MGKRKKSTRKPQGPKKADPLPTTFTCLFCNHENSVTVKLDKKAGVGQLDCNICCQKFQCGINYLSAAVDVFSEWVDAADAVASDDNESKRQTSGRAHKQARTGRTTPDDTGYYGEDDDSQRYKQSRRMRATSDDMGEYDEDD